MSPQVRCSVLCGGDKRFTAAEKVRCGRGPGYGRFCNGKEFELDAVVGKGGAGSEGQGCCYKISLLSSPMSQLLEGCVTVSSVNLLLWDIW